MKRTTALIAALALPVQVMAGPYIQAEVAYDTEPALAKYGPTDYRVPAYCQDLSAECRITGAVEAGWSFGSGTNQWDLFIRHRSYIQAYDHGNNSIGIRHRVEFFE